MASDLFSRKLPARSPLPEWAHIVVSVCLILLAVALDVTRPFGRNYSIFYLFPTGRVHIRATRPYRVAPTQCRGSTFRFTICLPVAPAPDASFSAAQQNERLEAWAPVLRVAGSVHALVVEDNPVNRLVAVRLLEKLGCAVQVAANGKDALVLMDQSPFDIVFMDYQMPEMDGLETTQAIRQREALLGKRIPIVAMTASVMAGDRDACLSAGMDDYIAKPISVDDLRRVLDRWHPGPNAERTPLGDGEHRTSI